MDERHGVLHAVEGQEASRVVNVDADASELLHVEGRFHAAVPGGEGFTVPLQTPGEVVARDAAVALAALAVDALVGQAHVRPLAADVHLKVVAAHIEALRGQDLPPVLEALRCVGVRVLPGRGVRHLPVLLRQAQERVSGDSFETHVGGV